MQPFVATVALSTCVCWSLARVAVNELNWSRCCLGCGLVGAEGTMYYVGAWKEGRALLEIILGNGQACLGDSSYLMQLLWSCCDWQLLVLTPTRELARQVADVISSLTDSLSTVCVYGGAPIGPQGIVLTVDFGALVYYHQKSGWFIRLGLH